MKQTLCLSALVLGLIAGTVPQSSAQAQSISFGRGGVRYNAYGQGYYGGYGQGYRGYRPAYGPRVHRYSGYGNGPYGYGSPNHYQYRSRGLYGYGDTYYYNRRGYSGYYDQTYAPVYSPIGFGVYNSYSW